MRQQAELLSAEQRESLKRDGYLLVPALLDETVLGPIANRLEELVCQTVAAWDSDPGRAPTDVLAFRSGMGPHPDEVKIVAPAGSVILFNSADLWHSGTLNYSPAPRLAVTAAFSPGSPSC